jgi:hypothetical protein
MPLLESSGGVSALSEIERGKLAAKVIQLRSENKPPNDANLRNLFLQGRKNTTEERGGSKHYSANIEPLCDRTVDKYKRAEYSQRTAQPLTTARKASLLDPITTITYGQMLLAFAGLLPATNKINFDGTTVEVPDQSKGRKVYIHKLDPVEGPVACDEVQSALGILIKLIHIVAGSGHKGRMVAVIAVKEMPEGEFYVAEVKGLHNTTDMTTNGFLYASSTRAGNAKMWTHFFLSAIIPFVSFMRENYYSEVFILFSIAAVISIRIINSILYL